ncbi:AMP-binding protein [Dactylosporangium sp. NPDC000555]|uniref:AMP-binding protein n=1 Tax=Dactylosporangium sp. NPDC000555 TaxID=3154260 RepID=UPI0033244480
MNTSLVAPGARLIDATTGDTLTGESLTSAIGAVAGTVAGFPTGAVFARTGLTVRAALSYLGCWEAHRPVVLLDPALNPQTLADMVRRFTPAAIVGLDEGGAGANPGELPPGYERQVFEAIGPAWVRRGDVAAAPQPHPDLGLMLATSGSTGDPKLVRLSRTAIASNAVAIGQVLHLDSNEIAPTSLPLFYSYGMSVLNSHLAAGAAVVVVDGGVLSRDFWAAVDRYQATSLAGVPYNYEMLAKIRWSPAKHPSLRMLTQAGGRLRNEMILAYHEKIQALGGRFYVMWGQTEAGPRMSTLPAERLPEYVGSPGCAVPGGSLSVRTEDGTETQQAGVEGEIIYRGSNVMMGYADNAADLSRGDDLGGVLATGDLGYLDEEGFLFLTGRLKRIGKVFGIRVNLDDIEKMVGRSAVDGVGPVAAVPAGDGVVVWCEGDLDASRRAEIAKLLAERMKVHRSGFDVRAIDVLPLLSNGKVDYKALEANT